jgi:hypothetical protein
MRLQITKERTENRVLVVDVDQGVVCRADPADLCVSLPPAVR